MIGSIGAPGGNGATAATPAPVGRAAPPAATASPRNVPRLVALANDLATGEPPVDGVRVAQLRQAIADGTYQLDLAAIARALLTGARKDERP